MSFKKHYINVDKLLKVQYGTDDSFEPVRVPETKRFHIRSPALFPQVSTGYTQNSLRLQRGT